MRLKRFARAAAGCVLFLLLTLLVGKALDFALTDDVHSYSRIMLEELYASEGTVDTLFLGSSHSYRSFDPELADALLGVHSFNAGSSQQMPDGSYHMLVEAGESNPLRTVYLECFFAGYIQQKSSNVPLACYLLTDYMRPSANKYSYLLEMGGLAALADDFLPARHSIASPEELPGLWRAKLTDAYEPGNYRYVTYPGEEEYRGRGFVYTCGTPPYGFDAIASIDEAQPVSEFGQEYLNKITGYCADNGIRLVLVTAPLPSQFAANTQGYQAYVDWMAAYARQNGLEYWDFTLYKDADALNLSSEDFQDAHHLNGQGAGKFTTVFCGVATRSGAGQDVSGEFYTTVEEKLALAPDGTYTG
ncbi:MAG: hypothetical protein ACI4OL_05210 [Gemmiger sp.]